MFFLFLHASIFCANFVFLIRQSSYLFSFFIHFPFFSFLHFLSSNFSLFFSFFLDFFLFSFFSFFIFFYFHSSQPLIAAASKLFKEMVVDTAIDIGYPIDLCQLPMITSKNTISRQFDIEKYSVLKEIETQSISIPHEFHSSTLLENIIPTNENLQNDISFSIQIPLPGTCSTYFNIIYFVFIIRTHSNSFIV